MKIQYSAEAEICTYLHRIIDGNFSVPVSPAFLLGEKEELETTWCSFITSSHQHSQIGKKNHTHKEKKKKNGHNWVIQAKGEGRGA